MRDLPRKRHIGEEVLARIKSTALVRPFLSEFPGWHRRSAFLSAQLLAKTSTSGDRLKIENEVRSLGNQIRAVHQGFREATALAPDSSRVRDVDAAFIQLLETLNKMAPHRPPE